MAVYNPFVYWGQNDNIIFLKVDLKDILTPNVVIDEDKLHFDAFGLGVRGLNNYELNIEFYLPIDAEKSKYTVFGRHVEFKLQKVGVGECWPRLTYGKAKPGWLKIDFDHFTYEDDSGDNMEQPNPESEEELMKKIEKELKLGETTALFDYTTLYLFIFNMFQWIGYSYIFITISFRYIRDGEESIKGTFDAVGPQLIVCQLISILEIVHPVLGWVRSNPLISAIQVCGRNMILFMLIVPEPRLHDRTIVWWLFLTWSCVEVVRYPYYMLQTVKMELKLVTWLRYTVWIPLYPLGFVFEGFVMLLALPYFETSGKWSMNLPNALNFALHFPTVLRIYMLIFLPGAYLLMKRMYQQRKNKFPSTTRRERSSKSAGIKCKHGKNKVA